MSSGQRERVDIWSMPLYIDDKTSFIPYLRFGLGSTGTLLTSGRDVASIDAAKVINEYSLTSIL